MVTNLIDIIIVSNDKTFAQAMKIRRDIFVEEFNIPEQKEFDGNDYSATHILALDGDKPIGTMRIRYFGDFVKMERMCVLKDYRKTNVSEQIMQHGISFVAQKGYEKIYGVCKKNLLDRWQKDGFEQIPNAPLVEQNGQILVPICCNLEKPQKHITLETDMDILNTKEGEWFIQSDSDSVSRIKSLTDKVKQIKQLDKSTEVEVKKLTPSCLLNQTDDKTY